MADFKDVIMRLQENKNDNREVVETQTRELVTTVESTTKSQNRSFGQSLALQFKKNNDSLASIKETFTNNFSEMIGSAEDQANAAADRQQAIADEAERNALLGEKKGADDSAEKEADGVGKQTKKGLAGILGKLGLGAGSAMLGGGALLAGAGILAGGAGYLLSELNDMDGKAIRANVKELMGISDDMGGKVEFFLKGGSFMLAMTGVGLGLAAFSVGAGVAAAVDGIFQDSEYASNIRSNVNELMSISDDLGSNIDMLKDGAAFGLAMTGIGIGLAAVSTGIAVSKAFDMFKTGEDGFAKNIRANVKELLSIKDDLGGNMEMLKDGGAFTLAMTGIGLGLAAFGAGSAVATLVDAGGLFANPDWATSIKNNVVTLLSIDDAVGSGLVGLVGESAVFLLAMSGIAAGLAVFGAGSAVAALTTGAGEFINPDWAQGIVDNVTTLLSIASLENLVDTALFVSTMTGIGAGLLAFSVGKGAAGIAEAITQFSGVDFAQTIKDNVSDLLSITEDEGINVQKATDLASVLGIISAGLVAFSGAKFVDALVGVGASILNFFSGNESPVQEMLNLADNAEDLTTASTALDSLATSLGVISAVKFDGSKINMKAFAKDLSESVPLIEAAIMGGSVDMSWLPTGETKYFGLASPEIDFEAATQRISELRSALGMNMQEKQSNDMASNNQPVVLSSNSNQSLVNNSSSSTFSIQKSTTAPDMTMGELSYDF